MFRVFFWLITRKGVCSTCVTCKAAVGHGDGEGGQPRRQVAELGQIHPGRRRGVDVEVVNVEAGEVGADTEQDLGNVRPRHVVQLEMAQPGEPVIIYILIIMIIMRRENRTAILRLCRSQRLPAPLGERAEAAGPVVLVLKVPQREVSEVGKHQAGRREVVVAAGASQLQPRHLKQNKQ